MCTFTVNTILSKRTRSAKNIFIQILLEAFLQTTLRAGTIQIGFILKRKGVILKTFKFAVFLKLKLKVFDRYTH